MNKVLLNQVLAPKPIERLKFIQVVLASFDKEEDDIRRSWLDEVHKRIDLVKRGETEFLDFEEVFG